MASIKDLEYSKFKKDSDGNIVYDDDGNSRILTEVIFKDSGNPEFNVTDFKIGLAINSILLELRKINIALSEIISEEILNKDVD